MSSQERKAAVALAAATVLIHIATAWRFGYFRDELYFIACAQHLAWGYVDQPPLVAFAAWLATPFGYALLALRALPILAHGATVVVAMQLTRTLHGRTFAQIACGTCVALMPGYLALGNVLTTTSFEGLSWTLLAYFAFEAVDPQSRRSTWIAIAFSLAFGLYGKYSIALWAAALLIAIAFTSERQTLRPSVVARAAALCALLTLPNLLWQALHGWPFLTVIAGDNAHRHAFTNGLVLESRDFGANALAYLAEQLLYTGPLAVLVWAAGLAAPWMRPELRRARFLSLAAALVFVAAIALQAKGYYTIGMYASLFAVGAVVIERAHHRIGAVYLAAVAVVAIVIAPISIPVFPVETTIGYFRALGLTGRNGTAPMLVQPLFAEEFGWQRLARDVSRVYASLPPNERATTAIYADTYADAGAIDRYGSAYGLPRAISSQNSYWLWGPRGYSGATMVAIGASRIDLLRPHYRRCDLATTSYDPLKAVVEGPAPIYLCRGARQPLSAFWRQLQWYGA